MFTNLFNDTFYQEFLKIIKLKIYINRIPYTFICWYASQSKSEKWNGTMIALNASSLGKKEIFLDRREVFLPVTSRIHESRPRLTFPILGHPVDGEDVECVSFSVSDTRNFFFSSILFWYFSERTMDNRPSLYYLLFSILIFRIDPGQRTKMSISKVKKTD